ncbi:MAG: beta-ketoacyl-[acyl-carrier-protein] synthase family protein [Endomicrobium sp.]|nr:beta-ketoacyl-[acyl-carrier-protein] synthase family protein [Endomicrobium sp.]
MENATDANDKQAKIETKFQTNFAANFAITGLGLVSPLGNTVKENWRRLLDGESAVEYDKKNEAHIARVSGFNIKESLRQSAMADAAIQEALSDAKLSDCKNVGLILGESKPNLFRRQNNIAAHYWNEAVYHSGLVNSSVPLNIVSSACATGAIAIIKACNLISGNSCNAAVCGCAETSLHPLYIAAFKKMGVLSKKGHRPFDKDRDGFSLGEGAGFIVVENYDGAVKRGAKIYCKIAGFSCGIFTDDIVNISSSRKMERIINKALNGQKPNFIHAHGTATRLNDYFESSAIAKLRDIKSQLPFVSSTKAATGHTLSVSSMAGAIFSILTIHSGIIAPTLNFNETDIAFGLNYVVNKKLSLPVKYALSLSWGFGAQGAAIFFKC